MKIEQEEILEPAECLNARGCPSTNSTPPDGRLYQVPIQLHETGDRTKLPTAQDLASTSQNVLFVQEAVRARQLSAGAHTPAIPN